MKKYYLYLFLILLIAFFWRVWHLDERINIFGDSSRDVLAAREAWRLKDFPLISAFSSAGPFVFGPQYMWLLMLVYGIFGMNNWAIFYYFLILQSLVFVILLVKSAELIFNKKVGLILGLLVAISPRQIIRTTFFSQHTLVALAAAASVYFLLRYPSPGRQASSRRWAIFWCGFWISNAILLHYQALGLLILGLVILREKGILNKLKFFGMYLVGLILPALPFLYWDAHFGFANLRNVLDYLFIGQYRIYVPNRWLWHFGKFWPELSADLFFGQNLLGAIALYATMIGISVGLLFKRVNERLKFVFLFFLLFFFYLRFYRGEKFEGYLMYLHPLFFLVIAALIYFLRRAKPLLLIFLTVSFFSAAFYAKNIFFAGLKFKQLYFLRQSETVLRRKIGENVKFAVYDFADRRGQTETWAYSETFVLFFDSENALDYQNGEKIGFCQLHCPQTKAKPLLVFGEGIQVFRIPKKDFSKYRLVNRSPRAVYEEILYWWKSRPLKSSFNLGKFILERITFKKV